MNDRSDKTKNQIQFTKSASAVFDTFERFKVALADTGDNNDQVVAALLTVADYLNQICKGISDLRYYVRSA